MDNADSSTQRMRIVIRGMVQGVGFRPFIYRIALEMQLAGWVRNSPQGIFIEAEGTPTILNEFLLRIPREKPTHSFIQSLEYSLLEPAHFNGFEIRESETSGTTDALVLPDIAVCDNCLAEMYDPGNRRHRYPFINCTHCGPRFSIIEALPYDRPNTSMKSFAMCPDCSREYENPHDRRFHAQPIACPTCGPELVLWDEKGRELARRDDALFETAEFIRQGKIAAIKGLGGFHLVCDARNSQSVELLRKRKYREEKPFALMYPSLEAITKDCHVTPLEARLLYSAEAPIVLLERSRNYKDSNTESGGMNKDLLSTTVAANNPYLGAMLPSTPLHHLLLKELGFPVVATSGNLVDEPICVDGHEALIRLAGIADCFLVHNRPIVRHVDDSIVRIVLGRELVLRRARGYAPLPLHAGKAISGTLAVGGHLKNTVALATGENIFLSQHIGDLENPGSVAAFHRALADFRQLYQIEPVGIATDMHPDYLSGKVAENFGLPLVKVQHHHAHVAACMAENEIDGPVLGVAWDGTGYGLDGTIWGGEFLLTDATGFKRVAALRKFRLPGGAAAVREPRRSALGILYEIFGEDFLHQTDLPPIKAFVAAERTLIAQMLKKGVNSPVTTSAGRLFDAVASLVGLRQKISFEGQGAMDLEFAAMREENPTSYPFEISDDAASPSTSKSTSVHAVVDWEPMIHAILQEIREGATTQLMARKFHNTLAEIILALARHVSEERVALTGGCFQNRILLEETVGKLQNAGFKPFWHQRVPPGDGGIALGQIVAAGPNIRKVLAAKESHP